MTGRPAFETAHGRGGRVAWTAAAATAVFAAVVGVALAASTDFVQPPTSPKTVGAAPQGVVAANFDTDADIDLATVNVSGANVTILRNNGAAAFNEPASSPEDAGSFPRAIVAADWDGDGDQDLAVANQVSQDLTILRNTGAGNFVELGSSPEPVGTEPGAITAADLDGDTDPDLAVTNLANDEVAMLRNNGSGNFVQPAFTPEPVGSDPVSVAAADLDGDTDVDLAVANQQAASVTILRNAGNGNFTEPASSPEFAGTFPQGVTAADLDGDSDRDLAVANQGSDDVTILRNVGAGNFNEFASSPELVGDTPRSPVAAADFDNDGDRDLAVANFNSDNVTILRNSGLGNFAAPATSPESVGDGPAWIVAADFDGDLDPDLAVANETSSNVTILRNR